MSDKKIENEQGLREYIREAQEERERLHQQVDELADEGRDLAEEVHAEAVSAFHEHGSERIQELAVEFNITWNEAFERYANHLAPRPPGYTVEPRAGSVVELTEEERAERAEVKRRLEGRDLSGLTAAQLESLDIAEIEFLTRPRDGLGEA
jgi:hypothetical protein